MSRFKVGDYVVNKSDVKFSIIHIRNQDDLDFINSYGRYKNYRLALNIDYIRTLPAKQMAKFILRAKDHILNLGEWFKRPYNGGWV